MFILASGTALVAQLRLDSSLNNPLVPVIPHNDEDDNSENAIAEETTEARQLVVSSRAAAV